MALDSHVHHRGGRAAVRLRVQGGRPPRSPGTAKSDLIGESELQEGKVDGDKIPFVENANFQGMPLKMTYSGTMTSADEIAFTRNVADLANEKLVAKRVK